MQPNKQNKYEYLKYSGMAFEMLATIGVFTALGYVIDKKLQLNFPVGIMLGLMIGFAIAIYRVLKQL